MEQDLKNKNFFYELLKETILVWWDEEVEKHVVGGEKKVFNVFLVD